MTAISKLDVKATIQAIELDAFHDFPKSEHTVSSLRKIVQRLEGDNKYGVSETASPDNIRITRTI